MTGEWYVYMHERGHMVQNSMYNFGSAVSYSTVPHNTERITVHEIHRTHVSYLNNSRTPCQSKPREVEMDTCIQHHIEKEIGCLLPWHEEKTNLAKCTMTSQYAAFITAYDKIASLSSSSIARITGCLPSCKRNEFRVNIINRIEKPTENGSEGYIGYFYYPGGRYVEKVYYYTYDFGAYIADVGGLIGLFLGHSLLSLYDLLKQTWKNKKKCC